MGMEFLLGGKERVLKFIMETVAQLSILQTIDVYTI